MIKKETSKNSDVACTIRMSRLSTRLESIVFVSLMLLSQACLTQTKAASLKIGDPAPPLDLKSILQAPPGTVPTWNSLRGKVVVVEFWATWCAPCLGAISHLNALADQFQGRAVRFISVTEPPVAHVRTFLEVNPIRGWVALDPTGSVSKSYGVRGLPSTFIVDQQGRIAAITEQPERLTVAAINAALDGKAVTLPSEATLRGSGAEPAGMQNVLVDVLIRANVPRDLETKTYLQGSAGMPLKDMIATFYDTTPPRIVWPTPAPDLNINFQFRIALPMSQRERFLPFAQQALAAALSLKAHWETRQMNVLVLEGPAGKLGPGLTPAKKPGAWGSGGPGSVTGKGVWAGGIASVIGGWTDKIVVNETNLHDVYNVTLYWDPNKPDSIVSAVRRQLGLELVLGKRRIRVLIIDHINLPKGG